MSVAADAWNAIIGRVIDRARQKRDNLNMEEVLYYAKVTLSAFISYLACFLPIRLQVLFCAMKIVDRFKSLSKRKKIIFGLIMAAWLVIRIAFIAVPVIRSCVN